MCLLREMEDHSVHPKSKSNHGSLSGNGYEMKNPGHEVCDRDSSSESDRSHPEASAVSESSLDEHTSTQSDNDEDHGKDNQDTLKPVLSLGKEGSAFLAPKIDYNPSFPYIPYTADAYYGGVGVLTGYAPHAIVHPQQNDTTNSPVMLPAEPAEEEPIYVNAKQYHAILRRRQTRAKLEAQNKMVKGRKPYLRESRHRHAMKRARGSGGRFLNTKQQLQEQNQQYQASSGSMCSKTIGDSVISQSGPICTPSSDAAGASAASQDRGCLPSVGFRPTANFSEQGGGGSKLVVNGMQQRVSTIR
uniref:Nuclear transcription factor Y subunit n=1 Tax=Zea mays TaxID=4577 RepID=B6SPD7_MAIZE|nr:nuclear transcription factor Y subunit A-3 [Zea mays]|eukprot:NP_001147311.1 nuclear transcription factor Y subunit A-3 [Zea mays]